MDLMVIVPVQNPSSSLTFDTMAAGTQLQNNGISENSNERTTKSLWICYILWLPPFGWLGLHHFYLRNYFFGLFYFLTIGGVGVGWIVDAFRMHTLLERENDRSEEGPKSVYVDDAYILSMPWGLLGLHHFYLGNHWQGLTWLITCGCFGFGWILDLFCMASLVQEANMSVQGATEHSDLPPSYKEHRKYPLLIRSLSLLTSRSRMCVSPVEEDGGTNEKEDVITQPHLPWKTYQSGNLHQSAPPPSYNDVISAHQTEYSFLYAVHL